MAQQDIQINIGITTNNLGQLQAVTKLLQQAAVAEVVLTNAAMIKNKAMKAQAQIYAQWIAGALSSIQANARLGADGTSSYQYRAPATIAEVEALLEFEGSEL